MEYQKSAPAPPPTREPSPLPEEDANFLMTLAMVPGLPAEPEAPNSNIASEFERYCILRQGAALRREEMDNP